jgi:hypothetical protein
LTGVYIVNDDFKSSTYAVKLKDHYYGFDVSASYVYYEYATQDFYSFAENKENRQLAGLDISGSLWGIGLRSESAYNFSAGHNGGKDFGRYVAGIDYTFDNGLYLMAEYYYNGKGKNDYKEYNINDWMNSFGAYAENLGRQNLYIGQGFPPITDNLTWTNFMLLNLSDKSGIIYPWFDLNLGDNSVLTLTAYIPFGKKETEYGGYGFGGMARIRAYF